MDALLLTLLVVFLAEMGDRTQLLSAALAQRFENDRDIFIALVAATICNSVIAAAAGSLVDQWISEDPLKLFTALAYIFAGAGMLTWRRKLNLLQHWKLPPLWTGFFGIFILQFGDKSQFLIAAHAAHWDNWWFVLIGGVFGIVAATSPALFLREKLAEYIPITSIRMTSGAILLLVGIYLVLMAFRLI